jgi:hypothetical protein
LQVCVVKSQVSPTGQSARPMQPTQVFVAASQTGVPPVHAAWLVFVHTTQLPPLAQA